VTKSALEALYARCAIEIDIFSFYPYTVLYGQSDFGSNRKRSYTCIVRTVRSWESTGWSIKRVIAHGS